MATKIYNFPKQKISYKDKTEEWFKENVRAGIFLAEYDTGKVRKSKSEMDLNYKLISGGFDDTDVDKSLNPLNLKGVRWPVKIQNYPIELTKLDVLKGEEISRPFNWFLRAVNDHVIILKEERQNNDWKNYLINTLEAPEFNEMQAKTDLQKMKKYYNYDYQDEREEMGTRLLQHLWKTQKIPILTTDAFYDIVTVAEELYAVDIFHGEPKNRRIKPKTLTIFGNGNTNYIEDSFIIVEDDYMAPTSVHDMFYEDLSEDQMRMLDEGVHKNRMGTDIMLAGPMNLSEEYAMSYGTQLIPLSGSDYFYYGGGYDDNGNIRVRRVVWASKVKVGKLTYYVDQEEMTTYVSEDYKINKGLGEKIEWLWFTEWCQGYCIGNANDGIFTKMERLPRLGMTFNNPSKVLPPYVGTIYSIGDKAFSLVDRIKPYKYLYNITMTRAELASARNKGILAEMDLARIPDGWEPEIWMMYAELNGWFITDSFKAGNEGPAMGKLLSNLNNRAPSTMNLDASQVIISNLEFARYIKNEINEITGITPQREGQVSNRETLGGVNRSLQQSSFITEPYFYVHDNTKLRLLELNLETAKHCYRDQTFSLNIMDDGLIGKVLNVNGPLLAETAFGMYLSDGKDDAELFQYIRQYAHAALQNDTTKFKTLFDIMRTKSIAGAGKRLEEAEELAASEQQLQMEKQMQSNERISQNEIQWQQMKFNQEMEIEIRKLENDLIGKQMELEAAKYKTDSTVTVEMTRIKADIEKAKLNLQAQREKLEKQNEQFNRKLSETRALETKKISMQKTKEKAKV